MSSVDIVRTLLDQWERVWHQDDVQLIASCLTPHYIRHDEMGDRTVTQDEYAAGLDNPSVATVKFTSRMAQPLSAVHPA